ncbi:unnamed protein product [Rotaria sordida]|uniref:Uncharacterized protein n=1 Tax=Rotaria sordida TaxID=392033 RepID=A0A820BCJ9_9BILA|nr:unnamed protein product [Rotaria sordida]
MSRSWPSVISTTLHIHLGTTTTAPLNCNTCSRTFNPLGAIPTITVSCTAGCAITGGLTCSLIRTGTVCNGPFVTTSRGPCSNDPTLTCCCVLPGR